MRYEKVRYQSLFLNQLQAELQTLSCFRKITRLAIYRRATATKKQRSCNDNNIISYQNKVACQ